MAQSGKIRLYIDASLGAGQTVPLTREASHYLCVVMRASVGDSLSVFNGFDGEWQASITALNKKNGTIACVRQSKPQETRPDLWLLFAPIKKTRTDFIVEKAAELGVARICPIATDFTQSGRIARPRLQAHAIEATEQCGGTFVPEVAELARLSAVLDDWPADRFILFCDETLANQPQTDFTKLPAGKWAILIGPAGGFSQTELNTLRNHPQTFAVNLGPRILRTDTAAVAAITLWQKTLGDWRTG